MLKLNVRKGDQVLVLSGNERGARGKVLSVDRESFRAIVEGVAIRKKHVRRSQQNPKGGVIEKESPIHVSNLMMVCPKCGKPSKMGRRRVKEASLRFCKSCEEVVVS